MHVRAMNQECSGGRALGVRSCCLHLVHKVDGHITHRAIQTFQLARTMESFV